MLRGQLKQLCRLPEALSQELTQALQQPVQDPGRLRGQDPAGVVEDLILAQEHGGHGDELDPAPDGVVVTVEPGSVVVGQPQSALGGPLH